MLGLGVLSPPQLITAMTGPGPDPVTSCPQAKPCVPLRGQPGHGCHRVLGTPGDAAGPRGRSPAPVGAGLATAVGQSYGAEPGGVAYPKWAWFSAAWAWFAAHGRGLPSHGRGLPPPGRGVRAWGGAYACACALQLILPAWVRHVAAQWPPYRGSPGALVGPAVEDEAAPTRSG